MDACRILRRDAESKLDQGRQRSVWAHHPQQVTKIVIAGGGDRIEMASGETRNHRCGEFGPHWPG